jgi:HlyD family secretion protein
MLAGPRPEEVAQAEAALRDAESQLALRAAELASQKELAQGGYVSPNSLRSAQTAHASALSARDSARERLELARDPYRPEEIEQARASYGSAQASVARAEHELALTRKRSTPEDIASARARRDAARARLDSAQADLRLVENRTRPEELDSAQATVRQAEASLRRAEAERTAVRKQELQVAQLRADLRRSEAALEQAADQAGYTIIRAPIGGVVTRINVEEGEYVQGGAIALPSAEIAMLVITSDRVWVECNIDEADVGDVERDQPVEIFLTDEDIYKGHVHHISPSVRLVQGDVRTFAVRVAVDGEAPKLRSGMSVDVDIIIRSTENVLSVPSFAIMEDKDGEDYVYVMDAGKAERVEIKKGAEGLEETEALTGVKEGDKIITSVEAKGLRDGAKVKLRESEDAEEDDTDSEEDTGGEDEEADPGGDAKGEASAS